MWSMTLLEHHKGRNNVNGWKLVVSVRREISICGELRGWALKAPGNWLSISLAACLTHVVPYPDLAQPRDKQLGGWNSVVQVLAIDVPFLGRQVPVGSWQGLIRYPRKHLGYQNAPIQLRHMVCHTSRHLQNRKPHGRFHSMRNPLAWKVIPKPRQNRKTHRNTEDSDAQSFRARSWQ
jgi:hypothetical protein